MEALAEASADLLDLTPNYDVSKQSFLSSADGVTLKNGRSPSSASVRYVTGKSLPAQHPIGVTGGGSFELDESGHTKSQPLFDVFTGIIDGISGELLHGTREYVLTGEIYEGAFCNGLRHGDGAIAKNVFLPSKSIGSNGAGSISSTKYNIKFYGSYQNDSPHRGTLVISSLLTYQGPMLDSRPHGSDGTLIKSSGYKYEGNFRHGHYHGYGTETEQNGGVYKGTFESGLRQGNGEYTITSRHGDKLFEEYSYKGQWVANQRQGEGEERVSGKGTYRGQFYENARHGCGSVSFDVASRDESTIDSEDDEGENDVAYHDEFECNQMLSNLPQHKRPVVADGIWRAGHPLNGTQGWTLMYENGDVYIGYADNFIPSGYGVMRYANKDVYTGQWKNNMRSGEGSFISGNGREEYVGQWKDDKIVPMNEGEKCGHISKFTDMALSLLHSEDGNEITFQDEMEALDDNSVYERQREVLESVVQKSLLSSIEMMQEHNHISMSNQWKPIPRKAHRRTRGTSTSQSLRENISSSENETRGEGDNLSIDSSTTCDLSTSCSSDADDTVSTSLKTYPNGDTFLGSVTENGHRQGYGVYLSTATGSSYSGKFIKDVREGYGILIHPLGKYCGEFKNDVKQGKGTLILEDSSSFYGNFLHNQFHGKGTLCTKDSVYVGDWCKGMKYGNGYETLPNGRLYMGDFIDNRRSGVGTLYDKAGGATIYVGSWENGVYQGEGVSFQRSRSQDDTYGKVTLQYEGSFFNGLRHGYGSLVDHDRRTVFKGNWHRDQPQNGKWRITYENGETYSGDAVVKELPIDEVEDNHQDWWSDLPQADIPPKPLNFRTGIPRRCGFGAMKYNNGEVYIGLFKDDSRHGSGSIFREGEKIDGIWENDVLRCNEDDDKAKYFNGLT